VQKARNIDILCGPSLRSGALFGDFPDGFASEFRVARGGLARDCGAGGLTDMQRMV
jgi:hypothetical protein